MRMIGNIVVNIRSEFFILLLHNENPCGDVAVYCKN